jgi:REP element-mobilizing transposase RayT
MPNHLHGIIFILPPTAVTDAGVSKGAVAGKGEIVGKGAVTAPQRPTLGQIIAYAKYQSTKRINILRGTPAVRVWQRNYYEHIIRNDADLRRIREYIANNPLKWELDQLHLDNPSKW